MKFSVGDPVYIKSSHEEGVIAEIIDGNTAAIKVGNKLFHAFFEDLEHPYLRWFLNKNSSRKISKLGIENIQKESQKPRQSTLPPGVYLVFFPQYNIRDFDEDLQKVKIYLFNETEKDYTFSYSAKNREEIFFEIESQIRTNSEFYIHDLDFDHLANSPTFAYHFIDSQNPSLEFGSTFTLKPKKLFEQLNKIKYDNLASFTIKLFEKIELEEQNEILVEKLFVKEKPKEKINHFDFSHAVQKSKYEFDLHIEKLVPNSNKFSSAEKLNIQLKEFEKAMDLASITHQRSVIFIHGVGKGMLKAEIHKILSVKKQTKSIKAYVNSYDVRYGYGATEVFF